MTRPDILLITTDQQRWDWLGCHGTPGVVTPHIDALAARGLRFTQHVTNSAVCVPARIGLATGVAPIDLGCLGNASVLPPDATTYYEHLRDAGYRVGVVGKLDLDKPDRDNRDGARPQTYRWGFTHPVEAEGKMHASAGREGHPLGPYGRWLEERGLFGAFHDDYRERMAEIYGRYLPDQEGTPFTGTRWYDDSVLPTDAFEDCWIGRRSCEWLREAPVDEPFHLYVSFVGPHDPFDPPTEYADRFRDAPVPAPVLDSNAGRPTPIRGQEYGHTEAQIIDARRQYTASLAAIDDQIGAIVATLEELGRLDETIIIFSSDHGEMLGDHRLFQKHVAYEPSMRIPLIVSGPGIATGVSEALTELIDLPATMLDLAGLDVPAAMGGRSLRPTLHEPTTPHRAFQVCCEHPYRAVRTATHKLVHYVNPFFDTNELYDLRADPDETTNLIRTDAALAAELRDVLTDAIGPDHMRMETP